MTQLRGTIVASPIVPSTDVDNFPTHLAKYGQGGYRSVADIDERDSIPSERLEEGMLVWVISETTLYQLRGTQWVEFFIPSDGPGGGSDEPGGDDETPSSGVPTYQSPSDIPEDFPGDLVYIKGEKTIYVKDEDTGEWVPIEAKTTIDPSLLPAANGIPIYTKDMVDSMSPAPSDYISIPSESELHQEEPGGNGYYVDILFSAIRSLQAEVAKLRNSMKYGLYSYTGRDTAMSRVMSEDDALDNEPLWATTEDDLSLIAGAGSEVDFLEPQENIEITGDESWKALGPVRWEDSMGSVSDCSDPKLYFYFTTSDLNITFDLFDLDLEEDVTLDLSELGFLESEKHNILVVVSRQVKGAGYNFVWISEANYASESPATEGYWEKVGNKLTISRTLSGRYNVKGIEFGTGMKVYKFDIYSKYQDFTNTVMPSTPSDEDYKYRVAHLAIRSVINLDEMNEIKDQLPKNELVYNEDNGGLYIKLSSGKMKRISGTSSSGSDDEPGGDETTSGMEKQEIITWLAANGIIVTDEGGELSLSPVSDITFVHQGTGKKFKFEADSEGNLHATELSDKYYEGEGGILSINGINLDAADDFRGFVGKIGMKLSGIAKTKDQGLYSDRVKIGAVYAPVKNQDSYGCSHAYIELENTSDRPFILDGCYIHFATGTCNATAPDIRTYHLALEGIIPGGGTYLIRGKQYTDPGQANCFINVETFDKEWYVGEGELIDLTLTTGDNSANTFALTYGLPDLSWTTPLVSTNTDDTTSEKAPYVYNPRYIDSFSIGGHVWSGSATATTWTHNKWKLYTVRSKKNVDCIYKNTFELEPAKQGYQALTTHDSSRSRNANDQDYQYVFLNKDIIEFPKTPEVFPVSRYTPKASWEHKNVSTDKTKLDMNKPNMMTCSFGINMHTTRCFNWISAGLFNEYVWVRKQGTTEWSRFESYKAGANENDAPAGMTRVDYLDYPELRAAGYERITSTFPGAEIRYTSHKCIVKIVSDAPDAPEVYEYTCGRADKNGNPDPQHSGEIYTFTLYPKTYTPKIYQTTDQQGFHWIEYQVWAAAAIELNDTINDALAENNIIPILVNTGDMTQNGTRINEWLDYYNAGKILFNHLEQMNVVGNNDLCGPDPTKLGTGDDNGKSNSFYFHVFYCYEVDPAIMPIIPASNVEENGYKFVPSFYYFENSVPEITEDPEHPEETQEIIPNYRFVFFNTEFTATNCKTWFKRLATVNSEEVAVNVYTGWPISKDAAPADFDSGFKSVYTMLYQVFQGGKTAGKQLLMACHEMPFTVVTDANLKQTTDSHVEAQDRSMNGASLVGCHANRLGSVNEKSIYWLSRLVEYFEIKLVIGGHKHTYACTNPLREFYFYDSGAKNSLQDGPMVMEETLENDYKVSWTTSVLARDNESIVEGSNNISLNSWGVDGTGAELSVNTTKFPLMVASFKGICKKDNGIFYPCYGRDSITTGTGFSGVTYFMCQATGYKLKSNKELPSPDQKFSLVIPKTNISDPKNNKPNANQQRPMFAEIEFVGESGINIYLTRIENIMDGTSLYSQTDYSLNPASYKYLKAGEGQGNELPIYGNWSYSNKIALVTL